MFFIWLLIVPLSLYIAYTYFPSTELDWMNILLLFGVMCLTMLLPIRFENVTVSLERWITFTIFFQYGVFAEFLFIQVAVFILLFSDKGSLTVTHKFLANSTIFAIVSIVSGFVFHSFGGVVGSLDFLQVLLFGLLYAITYTFVNNVLLKIYFLLQSRSFSLYSKDALWDYITTLLVVPLSISLYFLDEHLGNKSLMLVGVPFIVALIVLRMYKTSNTLNNQLSSAGQVGHELAERLLFDEVLKTFLGKLKSVISFENGYVIDLQGQKKLILLMSSESGVIKKSVMGINFKGDKAGDDGLHMDNPKVYFNEKEIKTLKVIGFSHQVKTVITAPIIRNQRTEGFLILTSNRKNAFNEVNLQILDILTGYFAISLEKARYFEKTLAKSEQCGLTKLHNFRYLDRRLDEEIIQFHLGDIQKLSVVILDIDYFKKINDTYGHESGNDLLVMIASLLGKYVGPRDTLARYGGEEFVLLLPDCDKVEASKRAERIRKEIEKTVFTITPDLAEDRAPIDVHMTVSLGVATMPDDAKAGQSLMRNADRALYIGGKQAGRNKVGVFGEHKVIETKEAQTLIL